MALKRWPMPLPKCIQSIITNNAKWRTDGPGRLSCRLLNCAMSIASDAFELRASGACSQMRSKRLRWTFPNDTQAVVRDASKLHAAYGQEHIARAPPNCIQAAAGCVPEFHFGAGQECSRIARRPWPGAFANCAQAMARDTPALRSICGRGAFPNGTQAKVSAQIAFKRQPMAFPKGAQAIATDIRQ
jgi:hypothetical protein